MTSKEVAKKAEAALANIEDDVLYGGFDDITTDELSIPRILITQALSDAVEEGKATAGQYYNTMTHKTWDTLEFVVLRKTNTFNYSMRNGQRFEWKYEEPATNIKSYDREFTDEDGNDWQKDLTFNYFIIPVCDFDAAAIPFPCMVSLKRTSIRAAKSLNTMIKQVVTARQPVFGTTFKLTTKKIENDKGKFFVADIEPGKALDKKNYQACIDWSKTLASADVKVEPEDSFSGSAPANAPVNEDDAPF
jgi:hypothetical protein